MIFESTFMKWQEKLSNTLVSILRIINENHLNENPKVVLFFLYGWRHVKYNKVYYIQAIYKMLLEIKINDYIYEENSWLKWKGIINIKCW
jgi:hypothetical protein